MGFHWTPCKSPLDALAPIGVLIFCLILAPSMPVIIRDIMHGLEWCCVILAVGMVMTSAIFAVIMRGVMPRHVIFIRGNPKFLTLEAPNANDNSSPEEIEAPVNRILRGGNIVALLPRSAYEWQDDRQRYIPARRD